MSASFYPFFYEHPPLAFALEALAFRAAGDVWWLEGFYGATLGCLTLALMASLWRSLIPNDAHTSRPGVWLVLLLFSVMPIVSWCFSSNMLENTLTVFTTLAVLLLVLGRTARPALQLAWGAAAGLAVLAALLTKGPTGLFPLAAPLFLPLVPDVKKADALRLGLGLALALAVAAALVWLHPAANNFFHSYWYQQVVRSLSGERAHRGSRAYILVALCEQLALPFLLLVAMTWVCRRQRLWLATRPPVSFLFAVALSASLPVALSIKQSPWYAFQSFPFWALAVGAAAAPLTIAVERLLVRRRKQVAGIALALFSTALLTFALERGHVRKDMDFHHDFTIQSISLPPAAKIQACSNDLSDLTLRADFARSFGASLVAEPTSYFLASKSSGCSPPAGCSRIHPRHAQRYSLYRCP